MLKAPLEGKALLEDLKAKFPPCKIEGHGLVIKIPGLKWEPNWEALLPDDNDCVAYVEKGETFVLVKLSSEAPLPQTPEKAMTRQANQEKWASEEENLLVKMWNEGDKVKEIHKAILKINPDRTERAVKDKIVYLERRKDILGIKIENLRKRGNTIRTTSRAWRRHY